MLSRQRYSNLLRIMAMESYNRQPWGIGHSSSSATAVAEPAPEQHNSKDASIGVKVVYTPPSDVQPVAECVSVPLPTSPTSLHLPRKTYH